MRLPLLFEGRIYFVKHSNIVWLSLVLLAAADLLLFSASVGLFSIDNQGKKYLNGKRDGDVFSPSALPL